MRRKSRVSFQSTGLGTPEGVARGAKDVVKEGRGILKAEWRL